MFGFETIPKRIPISHKRVEMTKFQFLFYALLKLWVDTAKKSYDLCLIARRIHKNLEDKLMPDFEVIWENIRISHKRAEVSKFRIWFVNFVQRTSRYCKKSCTGLLSYLKEQARICWRQTDAWFSNYPRKYLNFTQKSESIKSSDFFSWFCSKYK